MNHRFTLYRRKLGGMFYIQDTESGKQESLGTKDQHGTPWKLAEEVTEMHFPAPLASAVAATLVQFICAPFIAVGLFTRINAALLVGALSGATLQNLLAGRDPQLAILYTLIVVALALMGGGRFSLRAI